MSEGSRRSRRIFAVFLAASIAAHAAVFGVLPLFTHGSDAVPASVLQVTILEPMPLPIGPPEPVPRSRSPAQPDEARARSAVESTPPKAPPAPALALSEPRADERRSFAVGTSVAEPAPATAAEAASPAVVAVTPASVNAAYLHNPLPRYPATARRAGEQGTVMLRVLVSRDGSAVRVEIDKSSGSPHLDAAARETVKAWRFTPARRGAEAIESWVVVPVVFRLEGAS
jgi:periplasmic protein TonB